MVKGETLESIYDTNQTMRMIGNQRIALDSMPQCIMELQEIMTAYRDEIVSGKNRGRAVNEVTLNAFILGMIYGKRIERQKKQKKAAV